MTRFPIRIALTIVSFMPFPAAAQDLRLRPSAAYDHCLATGDAARGNVTAINICEGTEQAIQSQRLTDAYDRAIDRVGLWRQVALYNAQAEWRAGRDSRCLARASLDRRGDASAAAYTECTLDETIARAAWLEIYSPE